VVLRPLAWWYMGSNPTEGARVSCEICVLSGRGVCVTLITRPEVVCLSVIVKPRYWGSPGPLGFVIETWWKKLKTTQREKKYFYMSLFLSTKIQIGFHAVSDSLNMSERLFVVTLLVTPTINQQMHLYNFHLKHFKILNTTPTCFDFFFFAKFITYSRFSSFL